MYGIYTAAMSVKGCGWKKAVDYGLPITGSFLDARHRATVKLLRPREMGENAIGRCENGG